MMNQILWKWTIAWFAPPGYGPEYTTELVAFTLSTLNAMFHISYQHSLQTHG